MRWDALNLLGLVPNLMQSRAKTLLKVHVTGVLGSGVYSRSPPSLQQAEQAQDLGCFSNWEASSQKRELLSHLNATCCHGTPAERRQRQC